MKKIVFYSWQSDLPNSTNRGFIERALELATDAIHADDAVEVEPVLDRDTQGVAGSPDISGTIFEKIEGADVFVADVSIIGRLENERAVPNPNVLIELGYAIKCLEFSRILLVFNEAYGKITDLPFDLRTRRVISYRISVEEEEKAPERKRLSRIFQDAITSALKLSKSEVTEFPMLQTSIDIIEEQRPNKVIILRQELQLFTQKLINKAPVTFIEGGTVDQLIESIRSVIEELSAFARLTHTIAILGDESSAIEVHKWFGKLIEQYHLPAGHNGKYTEEDFDYYKFLGHELYTILIANFLKEERWNIIQKLFDEWIPVNFRYTKQGSDHCRFTDVSPFVRSLFVASKDRRRVSLEADLVKQHFENKQLGEIISFHDYMDADLFVFMVIELSPEKPPFYFQWRPSSFLYLKQTPTMFKKAQKTAYARFLSESCGVHDLNEFKQRLVMRLPKINDMFEGNLMSWYIRNEDIERIGSIP